MSVLDIVSDDEIASHHFGRFSGVEPRAIVNEGVLKAMLGYSSGSTVTEILWRHGLISQLRSATGAPQLSKKGFDYARAIFGEVNFSEFTRALTKEP